MIQSKFSKIITEKLSVQDRPLIMKILLILVKLSLTTTIKRENRGPVSRKPLPDL